MKGFRWNSSVWIVTVTYSLWMNENGSKSVVSADGIAIPDENQQQQHNNNNNNTMLFALKTSWMSASEAVCKAVDPTSSLVNSRYSSSNGMNFILCQKSENGKANSVKICPDKDIFSNTHGKRMAPCQVHESAFAKWSAFSSDTCPVIIQGDDQTTVVFPRSRELPSLKKPDAKPLISLSKWMTQKHKKLRKTQLAALWMVLPLTYLILVLINVFSLRVISSMGEGTSMSPFVHHYILFACDILLIHFYFFQSVTEMLGVSEWMEKEGNGFIRFLSGQLQPVHFALLIYDQTMLLLIMIDRYQYLKATQQTSGGMHKAKAILTPIVSFLVSFILHDLAMYNPALTKCERIQQWSEEDRADGIGWVDPVRARELMYWDTMSRGDNNKNNRWSLGLPILTAYSTLVTLASAVAGRLLWQKWSAKQEESKDEEADDEETVAADKENRAVLCSIIIAETVFTAVQSILHIIYLQINYGSGSFSSPTEAGMEGEGRDDLIEGGRAMLKDVMTVLTLMDGLSHFACFILLSCRFRRECVGVACPGMLKATSATISPHTMHSTPDEAKQTKADKRLKLESVA